MIKKIFVLSVVLLLLSTPSFAESLEEDITIPYAVFEGKPVTLEAEADSGRVQLCIQTRDDTKSEGWRMAIYRDIALSYLKEEVALIVTSDELIVLGGSVTQFEFGDGYPIWAPHISYRGLEGEFSCLFFGENVELVNGVLVAQGRDGIVGFNGYLDWKP